MPTIESVTSFALVAALVTITRGLDTALVLRATLTRGRRHAVATAAGILLGVLVWAVAAATGVSALLTASTAAYTVLRIAGASYMVVLGLRLLREVWRSRRQARDGAAAAEAAADAGRHGAADSTPIGGMSSTRWGSFRTGLLTNLLNPKVGAFYLALLPQFVPADGSAFLSGLLLGLVHDLETIVWFAALIIGADTVRRRLTDRRTERWIESATGVALVGFGIALGRSHGP